MRKKISYKLKRSKRAKRMRLAVYCDGAVVVTSPFGIEQSVIEKFISDKKQWIMGKLEYFKNISKSIFKVGKKNEFIKYRNITLVIVQKRVAHFNKIYKFEFNKITIKNQKTRWGSCSNKGNLNFNYKIAILPQRISDYIIVHELCHLEEFNHSRKFWNLVAKTIPDYRDIRKELNSSIKVL